MNILFLAPAWKVPLLKAFQEAKKSIKIDFGVIAADSDILSSSLYFADRYHIVPKFEAPNFKPVLLELCEKENITSIIPLSTFSKPFSWFFL